MMDNTADSDNSMNIIQLRNFLVNEAKVYRIPSASASESSVLKTYEQLKAQSTSNNSISAYVPDIIMSMISSSRRAGLSCQAVVLRACVSGIKELYESCSSTGKTADQFIGTLNTYTSLLVSDILTYGGDVVKISGDEILAIWCVESVSCIDSAVIQATECALAVQRKHRDFKTSEGLQLKVKMGIAAGEITIMLMGNDASPSFHVELGKPIDDVTKVEDLWEPGDVILSSSAWNHCSQAVIKYTAMEDGKHFKVMEITSRKKVLPFKPFGLCKKGEKISDVIKSKSEIILHSGASCDYEINRQVKQMRQIFSQDLDFPMIQKLKRFLPHIVEKQIEERLEVLYEERQIAAVCVNIKIDPVSTEHRKNIVDECYKSVQRHAHKKNGLISKVTLIEESYQFQILFGIYNQRCEDYCNDALICSSDIKDDLTNWEDIVGVSAGIVTGPAYCGVVGCKHRQEYAVIGTSVYVASRLTMFFSNKVVCDDLTYYQSTLNNEWFRKIVPENIQNFSCDESLKDEIFNEFRRLDKDKGVGKKRSHNVNSAAENKSYKRPLINRCLLQCVCTVLPKHQILNPEKIKYLRESVRALDTEFSGSGHTSRVVVTNGMGETLINAHIGPHHDNTDDTWSGMQVAGSEHRTPYDEVRQLVSDTLEGMVIIGHSVTNDLEGLEITVPHDSIRDTAQYRPLITAIDPDSTKTHIGLKDALRYFGYSIQDEEFSHCPTQDTLSSLYLYVQFMDQWECEIKESEMKLTLDQSSSDAATAAVDSNRNSLPAAWSDDEFWKAIEDRDKSAQKVEQKVNLSPSDIFSYFGETDDLNLSESDSSEEDLS